MFAFSAFGQGPHTEYYFILQGEGGGLWKSLRFERLLFLITTRLFLKWIKHGNLAHTHTYTHTFRESHTSIGSDWSCARLKENLFTEGVCKPEAFARAKCIISEWFMRVRSHYLCPNESTCLMSLLGGFFLESVFVFLQGLMEFDGEIECLHLSKWPRVNTALNIHRRFSQAINAKIKVCNMSILSKTTRV